MSVQKRDRVLALVDAFAEAKVKHALAAEEYAHGRGEIRDGALDEIRDLTRKVMDARVALVEELSR